MKRNGFFRNIKTRSIDKKVSELSERGNEELEMKLRLARQELEYAEERYERLQYWYDYSEDNKEALEDRIKDLKSKKREMTGFWTYLAPHIRRAFWRLGITKKGREYKRLLRSIKSSERALARMTKNGERRWEEVLKAEEKVDIAEENLRNIEKMIKKESKNKNDERQKEELKDKKVEKIKQEEVRAEEVKEEKVEEIKQEEVKTENIEEVRKQEEKVEETIQEEKSEEIKQEEVKGKEKTKKEEKNKKMEKKYKKLAKEVKGMKKDLKKVESKMKEQEKQNKEKNSFKAQLQDTPFVGTVIRRDALEQVLLNSNHKVSPEVFIEELGKESLKISTDNSTEENFLLKYREEQKKEGLRILEKMAKEGSVPSNDAEKKAKAFLTANPGIVKSKDIEDKTKTDKTQDAR